MLTLRIFSAAVLLFGLVCNAQIIMPDALPKAYMLIQTGAFRKEESVRENIAKLSAFTLLRIDEKGLTRIFVVTTPDKRHTMLRRVRKIIPDAFIRTRFVAQRKLYKKRKSDLHDALKMVHEEKYISEDLPLDSRAILQTRRKFF